MSPRQIDLNLFRVFEAVMQYRSITDASRELHLTPSAVSHALSRLRAALSDKLFIAGEGGMEPTPRALELAPQVRIGLQHIDSAVQMKPFEPAAANRTFRMAASDYGSTTIMPRMVARLARLAPAIDLRVLPFHRRDTIRQLEDGRLDLAISWFGELPAHMRRRVVWTDSEAIVTRIGHPLTHGAASREKLLAYPHVVVELQGDGDIPDATGFLEERGVTRRVRIEHLLLNLRCDAQSLTGRAAVSLPHYASVIPVVQASDMIGTLPRSMAKAAADRGDLALLALPYEPMVANLEAIWHQRADQDPGLQWLLRNALCPLG